MAKKYPLSGGSGMRAGFPRTNLSAMDDVTVDNPQRGEGLVWNGTNWENAVISGGGNSNLSYFMTIDAGSLPSTRLLDTKPHDQTYDLVAATVKASTSPQSLRVFVSAELGKTVIQGGVWNFIIYGCAEPVAGASIFRIVVSKSSNDGGTVTELFRVDTEPVDSTNCRPIEVSVTRPEISGLLVTDKLMIEIGAVTDSVTDVIVTLVYGALDYPTRCETPMIINHSDVPGLDYTVDGHTGHITLASDQFSAVSNKCTPVDNDRILIEDSEDSYSKKNIEISNLRKVRTSASDLQAGYLVAKLEAGIAMAISEDTSDPSNYKAKLDVSLGTLSDQAAAGDDPRLSDARTPTVHDFAGALHQTSNIAAIQSKVSDGKLITSASAEISTIAQKCSPTSDDLLLIEDAADSNKKKRITVGDLPFTDPTKVKVSSDDTTADYLADKINTDGLTMTVQNPGGNEKILLYPNTSYTVGLNEGGALCVLDYSLDIEKIDPDYVDGAPGTPSLRTLGTLSNQAAAGNDSRLSDSRTPTVHDFAGALHQTSSIAAIQGKVGDGSLFTTEKNEFGGVPHLAIPGEFDFILIESEKAGDNSKRNTLIMEMFDDVALPSLVSWRNNIIKIFDNTSALPVSPQNHDRYIAKVTANGWTKNYIYQWMDATSSWVASNVNMTREPLVYNRDTNEILYYDLASNEWLPLNNTPAIHDFAGALHQTSSIAAIQSKVSDGSLITTAAGEINAIYNKCTPVELDLLLIEDSEDSNNKKNIYVGAIPVVEAFTKWSFSGILTPIALSGNTDNYNPTDLATNTVIRISSSSAVELSGLATGAAGRFIILTNVGNYNISLEHEDSGSSAANRFTFNGCNDFILTPNKSVILQYDGTTSRWRGIANIADPYGTAANTVCQGNDSRLLPEFQFFADQLKSPTNAEYPVNGANIATVAVDSANGALINRQFDDTTDEGVAFDILIPSGATNIILEFYSRAQTAPGTAKQVIPGLYTRQVSDNAAIPAWSAKTALTAIDIPITNAYFQYDTQTIALSTLSLTAGKLTNFELIRDADNGSDSLVGDWNLNLLRVRFS
jgi:hypothetical protein